jgi:hypothetical protein
VAALLCFLCSVWFARGTDWAQIHTQLLESTARPPAEGEVIVINYRRSNAFRAHPETLAYDESEDSAVTISDTWQGSVVFGSREIKIEETLIHATHHGNASPRVPLRMAVGYVGGDFRRVNVFEELRDPRIEPRAGSFAEIRREGWPEAELPFPMHQRNYHNFLSRLSDVVVAESAGGESYAVAAAYRAGDFSRSFSMDISRRGSLYLLEKVTSENPTEYMVIDCEWKVDNGQPFLSAFTTTRRRPDGAFLSSNIYMFETPRATPVTNMAESLTIRIPVRSQVEDYRWGARLQYQLGSRFPTAKEVEGMFADPKARADYFRAAMTPFHESRFEWDDLTAFRGGILLTFMLLPVCYLCMRWRRRRHG